MTETNSTCTKILIIVWVIVEVALYAGLIDGWASLVYVLKGDGHFSSVCHEKTGVLANDQNVSTPLGSGSIPGNDTNSTLLEDSKKSALLGNWQGRRVTQYISKFIDNSSQISNRPLYLHIDPANNDFHTKFGGNFSVSHVENHCLEQEELLNLVFTIGVFSMVFAPVLGLLYDRHGCTATRIVALAMFVLGMVLMAFSAPGREWLLFPSTILLSLGGQTLHLTDFQVAPLFAQHESTIATLVSGAYDTSATTFLLFKLAYDAGFSLRLSALSLAASATIICSITTLILPQKRKDEEGSLCQRRSLACRFLKHLKGPDRNKNVHAWHDSLQKRPSISSAESAKSQALLDDVIEKSQIVHLEEIKTANIKQNPDFMSAEQTTLLSEESEESHDQIRSAVHVTEGDMQDKPNLTLSIEKTGVSSHNGSQIHDHSESAGQTTYLAGINDSSGAQQKIGENAPFTRVLKSPIFLITQFWLISVTLLINVFIGIFNSWIEILSGEDIAQVSHFTNVFGWMQMSGMFMAPLAGIIVDRQRNRGKNNSRTEVDSTIDGNTMNMTSKHFSDIDHFIPSFILTNICALMLTIGCSIPVLSVQYGTMLFYCMVKPFAYGVHAAFLAHVISRGHFGKSYTLQVGVIEVTSWLQFPLFTWFRGPLGGNPLQLNLVLIAIACVTFCQPLYIWVYCRRHKKREGARSEENNLKSI